MRFAKYLLLLLLFALPAKASDIYFANAPAGAANGTDCADAYAWTDVTHGINVATQQATAGNGNTLHLCGTITAAAAGINGIVAAASGSPTAPIIVKFEPGAVLSSPQWPGAADGPSGCGNAAQGGAIVIHGFSNWIIDGGLSGLNPQGIIQNTANGTGLANSTNSLAVWFDSGDNFILRNIITQNIYVRLASAGTSDNGGCSAAMRVIGATSTKICNNKFQNAFQQAEFNTNDSINVLTALPVCGSNTFAAHSSSFSNNTMIDQCRGAKFDGSGAPLIANNDIQHNNDNWVGNPVNFHCSGFFIVGSGATTFNPNVVGNYCHGDQTGNPTGCYYQTYGVVGDGSGSRVNYFNNICYGTASPTGSGATFGGQCWAWNNTNGNAEGPDKIYHNTTINTGFANESYATTGNITGFDYRGNLDISQPGGAQGYFFQGGGGYLWSVATVQGNVYNGGRFAPNGLAFGWFQCTISCTTGLSNFTNWKANCVAHSGTSCDSNSTQADPLLAGEANFPTGIDVSNGSAFYLTSSSSARGISDNLTAQCATLYGLCISAPQFFGAGGSCGTGCTPRPASGNWDAGAFQFSVPTPALTITPTPPLAFGNQQVSTTSSPHTLTITNTGTGPEILSTPWFTITTGNSADFFNIGGSGANGATIPAGGSVTWIGTFKPSIVGAETSLLTIQGTVNATANLTGTGTAPLIPTVTLNARIHDFGTVNTGSSSGNFAFLLTNSGTATLTITSILSNNAVFPINSNTCGGTLAPAASCGWNATFAPIAAGPQTATIAVTTNASSSPDNISLTGLGFTPVVNPPPAPSPAIMTSSFPAPRTMVMNLANCGNCKVQVTCVSGCNWNAKLVATILQ